VSVLDSLGAARASIKQINTGLPTAEVTAVSAAQAAIALAEAQQTANLIAYLNTVPYQTALRGQLTDEIEERLGIGSTT
jgi:hypothetical protein